MNATKTFTFDAAHKLNDYNGLCANLHGHTYKLHVTVTGKVLASGMIIDFAIIKKIVKKQVIDKLDHTYLNDTIKQPTAENITLWIWDQLHKKLPQISEIKLWETPTSYITYKGTDQ